MFVSLSSGSDIRNVGDWQVLLKFSTNRSLVKGVFCAGADLKERQTLSPTEVHRFVNSLRTLVVNIENLPMPGEH